MAKQTVKTKAKKSVSATADLQQVLSPDQRREKGKALREHIPRENHAGWKTPKSRKDTIEMLIESNRQRVQDLVPIRFGRMMQSPFAFYRGGAAIMAADLAGTPNSGITVQACGDAHLMNFGGFATPERQVIFDVNDLDETLPAPWEWDLKRLAASIVIAARHLELRESEAARAVTETVRAYRERMANYSGMRALDVWYDRITVEQVLAEAPNNEVRTQIKKRLKKAQVNSSAETLFPTLADYDGIRPRIRDNPPLIFHPTVEQAPEQKTQYGGVINLYRDSLPEHVKVLFNRFQFCDAALKVVGVGSVGTRCWVALFMASDDDPLFLQVKEARTSVLEPFAGKSRHKNHGERIVVGQRLMQAASDLFLGWTVDDSGRHFYFRQLRDMKISPVIEGWDLDLLKAHGKLCSWALARAHARSGDASLIAGYLGSSTVFDEAVCEFAVEYADQNQRDYRAFIKAVREGRLEAIIESV